MAPSAKAQSGNAATNSTPAKPSTSNGVITEPPAPAVNRKKAKRRAKEKARRDAAASHHADEDYASDDIDDTNLAPPGGYPDVSHTQQTPGMQYDPRYPHDMGQLDDPTGAGYPYSDDENQYAYEQGYLGTNGTRDPMDDGAPGKKNRKKKKKNKSSQYDNSYDDQTSGAYYNMAPQRNRVPAGITEDALRTVEQKVNDDAWEISTREERERIRQFWMRLPEKDRRELVKIEKDAVLKKMKEQQKHSCSCTVCGRKRTAIEEELEMLYDAYYKELEHYAKHGQRPPQPSAFPSQRIGALPQKPNLSHATTPSRGRIQEIADEDEEDELDDLDEEYVDDHYAQDEYSDDEYAAEEKFDQQNLIRNDFFTFGRNLTVKGGILTVADDLLSNQGEKFIDMMEQLANARMRREHEAFETYRNSHVPHDLHGNHYAEDDEYDDEEDYEDDDSQADEFEDDDEMDAMTEAQRMDEGRRMFQIFAARMFEQRVLGAYRDDVSKKKADQLIAEEEAEKQGGAQREAKKARDAEKKKAKKQQKRQAEAEKKMKKDEERAEQDRLAREAEEKRQEELRERREEQKRKREAEKKAQEEDRRRKEDEKRRQQEDAKAKQQERERQAREQKAAEKRRKDEERKKQQEEKEAKVQAARERKIHQEKEQREQEEKAKAEAEELDRKRKEEELLRKQNEAARKVPPPAVALPPSLKQQKSQNGSQASPQTKATTPAVPKATTPQQKQASAPASQASSSQEQDASHSSKRSTPPTYGGPVSSHPASTGSTRAPSRQPQASHAPQMTSPHPVGPPPGMSYPSHSNFPGMPPHAVNGLAPQGAGLPNVHPSFGGGRGGYPMGPQLNMPFRPTPQAPHFPHGVPQGPSGVPGRGFAHDAPPTTGPYGLQKGYAGPTSRPQQPPAREPIGSHSRQPSSSLETSPSDNTHAPQPIGRPQPPIQRPESAKPEQASSKNRTQSMPQRARDSDGDAYLGSSALLGDSEPSQDTVERRQTAPHPTATTAPAVNQHAPFGNDPPQLFGSRQSTGFGSPISGNPPGWTSGWAGPAGFAGAPPHRHGAPRLTMVRRLACEVFASNLSATKIDNTLEFRQLLSLMNANRSNKEAAIQTQELQQILDTEGDHQNGGGFFNVSQTGNGTAVSWTRGEPMNSRMGVARSSVIGGSAGGLGEIGSPLPSSRAPDIGSRF